jgi:hypothetical protein
MLHHFLMCQPPLWAGCATPVDTHVVIAFGLYAMVVAVDGGGHKRGGIRVSCERKP